MRHSFSVILQSFAITQNPESFIHEKTMEPDAIAVTRYTGLQVSPKVGRSGANIAETVIIAVALEPWLVLKMAATSHAKINGEMPVLWKSAVIAAPTPDSTKTPPNAPPAPVIKIQIAPIFSALSAKSDISLRLLPLVIPSTIKEIGVVPCKCSRKIPKNLLN